MKVLVIGGTGLIGRKIVSLALQKGYECAVLTRGLSSEGVPGDAEAVKCDRNDPDSLKKALGKRYFDVVVDQTCYNTGQAGSLLDVIGRNMGQFIFTSTACVYSRPFGNFPVTEEFEAAPTKEFEYGYDKRLTELYLLDRMHRDGPKVTIIRPSFTFGEGRMIGFFDKDYTLIYRMLNHKPIVCPGSGQSLWTITYTGDIATGYVGAFCNPKTYGEVYHLTTDEYHTWEEIFNITARVVNAPPPDLVYISGQTLFKILKNRQTAFIYYDKQQSAVFDNSKAKRDIPGFKATTSFEETMRKAVAWFEELPSRKKADALANLMEDRICEVYRQTESEMAAKLAAEFRTGRQV